MSRIRFFLFFFGLFFISFLFGQNKKENTLNSTLNNYLNQSLALIDSAEKHIEDSSQFTFFLEESIKVSEKLSDSSLLKAFNSQISLLSKTYKHELANHIGRQFYRKAKQQNDTLLMAHARKQLSASAYKSMLYDSTIFHLTEAELLFKSIHDLDNYGLMVLRSGGVNYSLGNYDIALSKAFQAAEIFKQSNKKKQLALAYMQMGNIYYFLKNYKQASVYYTLSVNYYEMMNDSLGRAHSMSNLGLTKIRLDSFQVCLDIQKEILPQIKKSGRLISLGNTYHYIAESFLGLNELDSAKKYIMMSNEINAITNFKEGTVFTKLILANIKAKQQDLDSAIYFGVEAIQILDSVISYEAEKEVTEKLAEWYAQKGNFKKAYEFLNRNSKIRDSLDYDINSIQALAIDQKTKLEKAELDLEIAKQKSLLGEREKHNQQLLILVLSIVAVISVFFAGVLSSTNKRNKALNRELHLKQEVIESELNNKRALLKEIHHRVKNNLQIISSMLSIQSQYIQDQKLENIIRECRSRILSMSLIHESLYRREDNDNSLFSNYIKELIPQLLETYHIDENKVQLQMDIEDLELSLDDSIPCGLIINEIISNALKHAFPNEREGIITIDMFKENGLINLELSDNGIGLAKEYEPERQDTFGFLLIYTLVGQLDAKMELNKENGVSFRIQWKAKVDDLLG